MHDVFSPAPREKRDPRIPNPLPLIVLVVAGILMIAAGQGENRYLLWAAMTAAGLAWLSLVTTQRVATLLVWLFVAANLVPGVDLLSVELPGRLGHSDYLMLLLALGTVSVILFSGGRIHVDAPGWLLALVGVTVIWWLATLLRTWIFEGVPLPAGAAYGRDLLYTPIAALLFCMLLSGAGAHAVRRLSTGVVVIGCYFAGAHLITVLGVAPVTWLIHPYLDLSFVYDFPRLYTIGQSLLLPALCLSGWLAVGAAGRWRVVWASAFLLLGLDTALGYTRAEYLGTLLALLIGLVVVVTGRPFVPLRRAALRAAYGLTLVISILALTVSISPSLTPAAVTSSNVYRRAVSIGQDLGVTTGSAVQGTLSGREAMVRPMLRLLGADWPWGMGFLNPSVRYFSQFQQGSIRNTDVGALSALMVVGAVGLVLALLLPLLSAWWLWRSPQHDRAELAIAPALIGYAVALVATAITLSTLFGYTTTPIVGGLLSLGIVLGADGRRSVRHTEAE